MDDRLSIGELARRARLTVSAVRFYSDRGVLPPASIDPTSGYRSFTEEQVVDAELIRDLRRLDMSLADVTVFLAAAPAARRALLDRHLHGLEQRLVDVRAAADEILTQLHRTENRLMTMTVDTADLARALDQVLPAAGRDPEKPALQCVLVEASEGSLRLVATDSFRLVVRDIASRSEASFVALVPAATLAAWRADLGAAGARTVGMEGDDLVVRGDGVELRARVVPATFPAYEAILEMDRDARDVVVDGPELLVALERVAGERGDAVLLTVAGGALTVERGEHEASVAAAYDGPTRHVAVDPTFAADAVRGAVGPDVVIEITDALRPLVFRSADDGTYTAMLMPVRLD